MRLVETSAKSKKSGDDDADEDQIDSVRESLESMSLEDLDALMIKFDTHFKYESQKNDPESWKLTRNSKQKHHKSGWFLNHEPSVNEVEWLKKNMGKASSSKPVKTATTIKASRSIANKALAGKTLRSTKIGNISHDENGVPSKASLNKLTVSQLSLYLAKHSKVTKTQLIALLRGE